jgi:hypothetical protein
MKRWNGRKYQIYSIVQWRLNTRFAVSKGPILISYTPAFYHTKSNCPQNGLDRSELAGHGIYIYIYVLFMILRRGPSPSLKLDVSELIWTKRSLNTYISNPYPKGFSRCEKPLKVFFKTFTLWKTLRVEVYICVGEKPSFLRVYGC